MAHSPQNNFTVYFKKSIPFQEVQKNGFVTLIHGGGGPADHSIEKRSSIKNSLEQILKETCTNSHATVCWNCTIPSHKQPKNLSQTVTLNTVKKLEACEHFNAGYGAALQTDGSARVTASFMESESQVFSAVVNVLDVLHPSEMAFYLQHEKHRILDGMGAFHLARELQIPRENLITMERFDEWTRYKTEWLQGKQKSGSTGTVGAVTLDNQGNLAASTSTGGVGNEPIGRIGDVVTTAGNYCNNEIAISCTGIGEQIINMGFSIRIATRVKDGMSLSEACEKTFKEADALNYNFCAIMIHLDRNKNNAHLIAAGTTDHLNWGALLNPTDQSCYFDCSYRLKP